ncbi:hypothetical protein [Nocardia pseudovaccinii]|uniref:hypothetical protein n=1 Tax=Nocardia pseudovaccinii TaxID=189540 RepID=UPI0007A3AA56|nr:hypothetical protein [Nocardia pseudovaccinii]
MRLTQHIQERDWTQAETAERVNAAYAEITGREGRYDDEAIRRLQRGSVTWPQKPYRQALAQAFGVPIEDLGFFRRNRRASDGDDVRRIDFLRGLAAVGGSSLLAGGLTATLDDAIVHTAIPNSIGPEHVAEIEQVMHAVRESDHLGHPWAWEVMAAQVRRGAALLEAANDNQVSRDLYGAVGALADAVGWAHFDAGHYRAADRYLRVGLHCADEAGAWSLRADILSDMARQAIYLGQPDEALTLLGAAKVREDRISNLRRANLSAVQARAFGSLGNARECVRAVRDADEHFHDSADDDVPDYGNFAQFYTFAQLNGDTGHALYDIAVHGVEVTETRHRLRVAIESYSESWARSRAFCLAREAVLTLLNGEPGEGAALGLEVVEEARRIGSARLASDVRAIHAAAAIDHPDVRALRSSAGQLVGIEENA